MKWFNVKVYFPLEAIAFHDAIQGYNEEHALSRAYWNWDQAYHIELV